MDRRGQGAGGFTIIETMIVLAVTALLFLLAVITIGGKQNETEFQQAINDAQSNLRKTINEVNAGNYQTAANLTCTASGSGFTITQNASPTNSEGSNAGCEFLGKIVQFGISTNNEGKLISFPDAGLECLNGMINGSPCSGKLSQVAPLVVAPDNGGHAFPDTSTIISLEYGLTVASVNYVSGAAPPRSIGAVGFINGVGSYSGGNLNSGTQPLTLVPIFNSNIKPGNSLNAAGTINRNLVSSYNTVIAAVASSDEIQVCLASGTTNQSGLITLGIDGSGSSDAMSTTIFSDKTCT